VAISPGPSAQGLGNEPFHLFGGPADIDLGQSEQRRGRLSGDVAREDRWLYVRVKNYG
jgi:hypothetical protein